MNFNDPKLWGPGVWFTLHLLAMNSTNHNETIKQMTFILNHLPCETCKQHALQFLKSYPPKDYIDVKTTNGLFFWTVKFHNAVNYRLGKPTLDGQVVYNLYLNYKN